MLTQMDKVAIFLLMIGFKKASSIITMMDNDDIHKVVPKIEKLVEVSPENQEKVWAELRELGYEDTMGPSETLTAIRMLFNGSKIGDKTR